ncbi:MAG: DNA mismatch repair protein MutS [Bradyrhizobiaceae bacterium]|nr:DNA mismatch repair protein MutS [Bradyrhizobiaceae bacterium]
MNAKETPLNRQYNQIKAKHPDTILLFRLGDFYETFGNDALLTSQACGITLTKRNNGAEAETPLAGFPHHQLDTYLPKLVKAGHRVAVCEQLEDPKQAKGIVKRGVVEIVTPGVVMYDKLLEHNANTFVCCLVKGLGRRSGSTQNDERWGMAIADISTGQFLAGEVAGNTLANLLESFQPAELLVNKDQREYWEPLHKQAAPHAALTRQEGWLFDADFALTTALRHFELTSLKGFGIENDSLAATAIGVVLHYVGETQRNALPQLRSVRLLHGAEVMVLDTSTRRNLEIHQSGSTGTRGALLDIVDRTASPMGGRLMRWWIQAPLVSLSAIKERQQGVTSFVDDAVLRTSMLTHCGRVGDLERLVTKVVTDRATARDLVTLKDGLRQIPSIKELVSPLPSLASLNAALTSHDDVVQMIGEALNDEAPIQVGTGKMFRSGYHAELDQVCNAQANGHEWIRTFQERERSATGISTLKVSFNNVFGYYIEVSKVQSANVPSHYERKQTLTNAERYTTPELKQLEHTLLTASEQVSTLEAQLLAQLRKRVSEHCDQIQRTAQVVAQLDCLRSFADVAVDNEYTLPVVHEETDLVIVDARHPVIEKVLPAGNSYVPNDITLDTTDQQILVITGPNMSGKSSYLRQTGLIVFLAHIGSYVPATEARIPLTDRIFTRVGAHDNLMAGESTFLVEMQEAANIIHNATTRSLILLDEVGRGTATFDGISIAWAIAEYLHEVVGAKTLFATHYHELTALSDHFSRIKNVRVEVVELADGIVFTHRVVPGSADHSFGIHVARMAGMPASLLKTASAVLKQLESGSHEPDSVPVQVSVNREGGRSMVNGDQLTIFQLHDDELHDKLRSIDIESLTPLQALQVLAELKQSID